MTDTRELAVISDAVQIIDDALQSISGRELLSSTEVADLLLDVRGLLSNVAVPAESGG